MILARNVDACAELKCPLKEEQAPHAAYNDQDDAGKIHVYSLRIIKIAIK